MTHAELRTYREVAQLLSVVWIESAQRYALGWADGMVARRTGTRAEDVRAIRLAAFGATGEATEAFRLVQAHLLVAQRFDNTVEQEHRDAVVAAGAGVNGAVRDALAGHGIDPGAAELQRMQDAGTAPAAGAWDPEWSDDRVADLAGVAPEVAYAIRESLPWVPPDARPDARRRRVISRLIIGRDPLVRVVRMMELLDPGTGQPYTAEKLLEVAYDARELARPRTVSARRRELATVVLATRIAWVLVDPAGRIRTPAAIAALIGGDAVKVRGIVERLGREAVAREGRPSRLTEMVCERVERADPRRFDRSSCYRWLIGWIWHGNEPASLRTVKGWRATGGADLALGRETLAARFVRAMMRLQDKAPETPVLPTAAELAQFQRGADARHVADTLGCTLEQITEARSLARRKS